MNIFLLLEGFIILLLCIKGFIMGLANLIPGISGGTLAITLGIYEQFIGALSNFFSKLKENILFLLPIGIGMVLSILTLSRVIDFGLTNYVFATIMLFIGAILGGLPMLCKNLQGEKINHIHGVIFALAFLLVATTIFLAGDNTVSFENLSLIGYVKIFFVGLISAGTMIIPGISGSAVLMTIGYYSPIISAIKNLTNIDEFFNSVLALAPFGIGMLVGMLGGARIIEVIINKYPVKAYFGVVGFVIASIIGILYQNFYVDGFFIYVNVVELVLGSILCIGAMIATYKLSLIEPNQTHLDNESVTFDEKINIYDFTICDITNKEIDFSDYQNKVLLIVNTASTCGLTPQFKALEELYQSYKSQNFEILGFPCNQFMKQDKGSNDEIATFCQVNYGVTFKMFAKTYVNGENALPLYNYLKQEQSGLINSNIKWNFTKFLVNRNGEVIKRYSPTHSIEKIIKDIDNIIS